jgi:hypothetical protein
MYGEPADVFMILASPFVGSFLAVVAIRLPEDRTVWIGRSSCDACGHVLSAHDLVPLVSFAILGGKCRYCGTRIDVTHPLMEAGFMRRGTTTSHTPRARISAALEWRKPGTRDSNRIPCDF